MELIRRAGLLALSLLLAACGGEGAESNSPAHSTTGPDPALALRALETQLTELQAADPPHGESNADVIARWRAFASRSRGTPYHELAISRLGQIEREAEDESFDVKKLASEALYASKWTLALSRVDAFTTRYMGTAAAARLGTWRASLLPLRERWTRSTFRRGIGNTAEDWKNPRHGRIGVQHAGLGGGHLVMPAPGRSMIQWEVELPELPERVFWRMVHLPAGTERLAHTTLHLSVNDHLLAGDWVLPAYGDWRSDSFEIRRWLRPGKNVLRWRLSRTSLNVHWLLYTEITDVDLRSIEDTHIIR